tara:strand:+ start:187 stop:429 length:243 start_codon:yes stop_codon:yes gene_type:complete
MIRTIIRTNKASFAILLFIMFFVIFQLSEPAFLYDNDGALRQFGLGMKNKTILPVWLLSIFLAIISYLLILYYLSFPKMY